MLHVVGETPKVKPQPDFSEAHQSANTVLDIIKALEEDEYEELQANDVVAMLKRVPVVWHQRMLAAVRSNIKSQIDVLHRQRRMIVEAQDLVADA